jgi:ribose transport system substrate-binding protein
LKRISLILMVALLCIMLTLGFSLLSCKAATTETTAAAAAASTEKKVTLGVVLMDTVNPSWVTLIKGGDIAAKEVGVEVIWKGSENSLEKEIANVENFIEQKVDCILMDPMDKVAMAPVVEKALKAGIPTVTMGNLVEVEGNVSTVYGDTKFMYELNKVLFYYLDSKGKVIYLIGQNGNYCSDCRQDGFDAAAAEFPDIEVLVKGPGGFDPVAAQKLMEDYLTQYPEIDAVSIWNDGITAAVATAIKNAGRDKEIVLIGSDADTTTIKMMEPGGMMIGNVMTGLARIGAWNIKVGAALARGTKVKTDNGMLYLPTALILNQTTFDQATANGFKDDIKWVTPADSMSTIENAVVDWQPEV